MSIRNRLPHQEMDSPGSETTVISRDALLKRLKESNPENNEKEALDLNDRFYAGLPFIKKLSAKNCLSIDISTDNIYYLVTKKAGTDLQVKQWGTEKITGDNTDRYRSLEISLKIIRSKVYRSGMSVQVSFFSPDINIRQVVVPKLKSAEIENAILYMNKTELTNFNDSVVWNYQVLESFTENDVEKVRALVTVVPGEVIDIYLDILERAGFKPDILVPRPFAFHAAYQQMMKNPANDVLIDISTDTTQIFFFVGGKLRFVRNFAIGANNLQKAIGNGDADEAAAKPEMIPGNGKDTGEAGDSANIRDRLMKKVESLKSKQNPLLQVLLGEILRSLEFFRGNKDEYPIKNVYVSGAGLKIDAVLPYLKNRINYPVFMLAPCFSRQNTLHIGSSEYTGALGIALFTGSALNMMPAEFQVREKYKNLSALVVVFLFIFLVFAGYLTYLQRGDVKHSNQKIAALQQRYEELNPVERIYEEFLKNINQVERKKNQLLIPVKPVPELLRTMKLFSNEVPDGIRLTSFRFTNFQPVSKRTKSAAKGAPTEEVHYKYRVGIIGQITGEYLMGDVRLINFMNHLNDLGYFKNIKLLNKRKQPENRLFEFELEAYL